MSTESTSSSSSPSFASAQRKGWRLPAAAAAILAVSAGLFGLHGIEAKADDAPASAQPAATPVSVATVAESEVTAWDEFSGRLEAVERVDIRSRVAGAVQAVHFREGALVKQGDLLITIDPAPYAAEVERAEAQVASAQARQSYARSEQERARRLWDERAIAQRELDERINAGSEAEANLRAAQASLQSARLNLGYTQVRAPVSGRIGKREITVGNLVAAGPGAPVLTTLVSVSPIYASFDADEQVITRALKELGGGAGNRARIDSIPVQMGTATAGSTPFEGRLQLIDNQVDARSGTVRVRAAFDNKDGALMPGQFARIRMGQARDSSMLLVSERAIGTDQSKKYVMVVGDDNKAVYREVALGASVNGLRNVTQGLQPGERVVVNGLQHIRLRRDVEIEVIDGRRRYGNGRVLPAGPLREPAERSAQVDFRVVNGGSAGFGEWAMTLRSGLALPLAGGKPTTLAAFGGHRVHAVAGIGHPGRFFDLLRGYGIGVVPHAFDDHHAYSADDLRFGSELPVLMTEKDAVKCAAFAGPWAYSVPVEAELPEAFWVAVLGRVAALRTLGPLGHKG